jgi:hypothetical protein
MTEEQKRSAELVLRDLNDIKSLRQNEPFKRFYLRRLREKRDAVAKRFLEDPPSKCDSLTREGLRMIISHYDQEILPLLDQDERGCSGTVDNLKLQIDAAQAPGSARPASGPGPQTAS